MNEHEIELIREYAQLKYLVEEMKATLNTRVDALTKRLAKLSGSMLWNQFKEVEKELRELKIHVWIEDDGGEVIYICTSKNMVKGRHGIKRRIFKEDMLARLDKIEFVIPEKAGYTPPPPLPDQQVYN